MASYGNFPLERIALLERRNNKEERFFLIFFYHFIDEMGTEFIVGECH